MNKDGSFCDAILFSGRKMDCKKRYLKIVSALEATLAQSNYYRVNISRNEGIVTTFSNQKSGLIIYWQLTI